ncbi:MAG: protein of unknown function UPF0118 [uncultured bacterium]|nr:MAG: protein of unknown function UPF0118 [uncultured bacterium]
MISRRIIEHNVSIKAIFKVVIIIGIIALLYVIRNVIVVLFISVVLASSFDPIVDNLQKKRIPRWVSVLIILIMLLGLIALIIFLMIPPVKNQIDQLTNNIPAVFDQFQNIKDLAVKYDLIDNSQSLLNAIATRLGNVAQGAVTKVTGAFSGLITIITIIVLSAYLVVQENGIKRFVKAVTPLKYRPYIVDLVNRIQFKMGQWLRGQLVLMLIVGGLTYIGLTLMGVDYALLLAILAGLLEIIPIIGIPIAIVPAIIISLTQSPILTIFVVILYIVIQQVENHILVPKVMQKAVGLNPVFVILALLIGYELAGILGVILSVPAATALAVFIKDFYDYKKEKDQETLEKIRGRNGEINSGIEE